MDDHFCDESFCLVFLPFATLSLVGASFMIFCLTWFRLWRSSSGRFILALATSDWLHAFSIVMSYHWVYTPLEDGSFCQAQAFILQFADIACIFCGCAISIYTYLMVTNRKHLVRRLEYISYIVSFGGAGITAIIGAAGQYDGEPIYGPIGPWCWVSSTQIRPAFFFAWIYTSGAIIVVFYALTLHYIWTTTGATKNIEVDLEEHNRRSAKVKKIMQKMAWYPLLYFCIFFPRTLDARLGFGNLIHSDGYYVFAIIVFTSNGILNALLYGYTRNIFALFRGQTDSTQSGNNRPTQLIRSDTITANADARSEMDASGVESIQESPPSPSLEDRSP
eukprot:TRINITY_DN15264_c0_g1_i1.p1 TRINITY_DN15264_c0_g1~~TRINITY_DN15264_c0_g1_i1.p1  ORF type:complete len:347 (-),score=56.10 TRINITY_DN15264_c0_g1_i1:132-1133(-)